MRKRKIAITVQRYGKNVNGGAEVFARMIAEKLIETYDVTILTSRALDYHTWKPELPEGTTIENGVTIKRFNHKPKASEKKIHHLKRSYRGRHLYQKFYRFLGRPKWYLKLFPTAEYHDKYGIQWLEHQGPTTYGLVQYIKENENTYDAFIFITYLYYPTAAGLLTVPHKSIFIPTMHDEQPAYFPIFQKTMAAPKSLLFLTASEQKFSQGLFKIDHIKQAVASVGVDPVSDVKDNTVIEKFGINGKYIVYVGRIDTAKGCGEMLSYFTDYLKDTGNAVTLVLAGKNMMDAVNHPNIKYVGFVSDEEKEQLIKHAEALIIPSKHESLSLVVLESFACKVPVMANQLCDVLKDHIELSNGGWLFEDKNSFYKALNDVMANVDNTQKGLNGYNYVMNNFTWDHVLNTYNELIDYVINANKMELTNE
ncbi:glycosyltransferase family 4 protein [Ferruginibacter yonginensis]|uniref:Glycosyltransferase family 4 protein n=1 Tax=Ferruginibacter yonginensis TaxID=1310416 RepID=A0ABV8QUJ4_9BACT